MGLSFLLYHVLASAGTKPSMEAVRGASGLGDAAAAEASAWAGGVGGGAVRHLHQVIDFCLPCMGGFCLCGAQDACHLCPHAERIVSGCEGRMLRPPLLPQAGSAAPQMDISVGGEEHLASELGAREAGAQLRNLRLMPCPGLLMGCSQLSAPASLPPNRRAG